MLLSFMGLHGTLNSNKCICCLPRSNKQDLSVCLVQVLSLPGYQEDVCVASRKNISQDSLTSVQRLGGMGSILSRSHGTFSGKGFYSIFSDAKEKWGMEAYSEHESCVSYLWLLNANFSHSTVIPVKIWIYLLSFQPLLCIRVFAFQRWYPVPHSPQGLNVWSLHLSQVHRFCSLNWLWSF